MGVEKPNKASGKSTGKIAAAINLYCDSDRQSHNNGILIPLPVPLKPKECFDELIAFQVHEMRSPLSSINLSTEMLHAAIQNEELKNYVDIIQRSSSRINDLITKLLNYQLAGKANEVKSPLVNIIEEVIEIMNDRIRLKNIIVVKNFCRKDFFIISSQSKIKIAITNIVANAIDAMPVENGVLKINTRSNNEKYLVEIEDNGCGISKENMPSIFNAGFTNKPGGLGFGLQITKVILQENNVAISVASKEGKGTKFKLSFIRK